MADGHVELYADSAGEHRWRRVAANGNVLYASTEGYEHRQHALEQAREANPGVTVLENGEPLADEA